VTTVPGSPTAVSLFSVSPDDSRIAVVVEDGSHQPNINLRLYVEDLHGGGHHVDIYSTTISNGKGGSTLWPMGWHGSDLVLAVVTPCAFEPLPTPLAWHVADSATAIRKANIAGPNCILSWWPSPSGVVCVDTSTHHATAYDWTGAARVGLPVNPSDFQSGFAPSGHSFFFTTGIFIGAPPPATRLLSVSPGVDVTVNGHIGCQWIDDQTVLATDAVIAYPSGAVTPLSTPEQCAGRFPGGL
jgi:hypothetical protein